MKIRKRDAVGLLLFVTVVLGAYTFFRSPIHGSWARIPAGVYPLGPSEGGAPGEVREVETAGFKMQRTEVTVGQFVRFLNLSRPKPKYRSPQIGYHWGRYHALTDRREPVAFVTYEQAVRYAAWLSRKRRGTVRLPHPDEWEIATRGGVHGIRFPWGWTEPSGHAQMDADGPARVAQYEPNAFGLYDMAGNVAEWCLAHSEEADTAYAMGGSWAERSPDLLRVFHRIAFPKTYRDADVGFRLIAER